VPAPWPPPRPRTWAAALQFASRTPSDTLGGLVAATYGSNNTSRIFLRGETGLLPSGGKAYLSYARQQADKWKGQGEQNQEQIGFKFVQPIGDFNLTGLYDYSKRRENDYQDLSFDMIKRLGYNLDNNTGRWADAVQIARAYNAAANYAGATPILDGNGCYTGSRRPIPIRARSSALTTVIMTPRACAMTGCGTWACRARSAR